MKMPMEGIGTFLLSPAEAEESVYQALKAGYRLVDTANGYMNERGVGRGIRKSGVKREDIFLVTKLWPTEYEDGAKAIDDTLARLDTDYVDFSSSISRSETILRATVPWKRPARQAR